MSDTKKAVRATHRAPGYPIPANDKVLTTEQLRGLALFAVQQAGLAAGKDGHGFFRPALPARSEFNAVTFEKGEAQVNCLAVLTRDGVAIVGDPEPLRVNDERPFTLVARWTLPPHAPDDAAVPAEITLARHGDKGEFDVEVELARISPGATPSVLLRAPLLSIEATKRSAVAVWELRDRLAKLGPVVEVASRQHPAVRALVGAELRSAAQSVDPSPLTVLERVAAILRQCAAMVRLEEGDDAQLVNALERASALRPAAGDGSWPASAWIDWIDGAASLLDLTGDLAAWLRGPHGRVALAGPPAHHAAEIYRFTYALDGISVQELRLSVKGNEVVRAQVQFRLDGGPLAVVPLQPGADGLEARIAVGHAKLIDILAPRAVEPVLHY